MSFKTKVVSTTVLLETLKIDESQTFYYINLIILLAKK